MDKEFSELFKNGILGLANQWEKEAIEIMNNDPDRFSDFDEKAFEAELLEKIKSLE